ncbi:uncharacterized protein LY89DRAFT_53279 [Mollisia scopiformis]|uniref:Uncharacterized protein n=1 Tax=Mollisia scopiformis TaxID=149040 RepID=A0A194XB82_MOLSC|nr:uncharacterized protein LY89DRAFT_53279 [Mollisia scopiformis]KUJ17426.1 hypothetical protein LY89DRAFT_53279 [Mollisia scopiformis]
MQKSSGERGFAKQLLTPWLGLALGAQRPRKVSLAAYMTNNPLRIQHFARQLDLRPIADICISEESRRGPQTYLGNCRVRQC